MTWLLSILTIFLLAIVSWSRYVSYHGTSDASQSKIKWSPEGLDVNMSRRKGVHKHLRTLRVHVVETPFTKVFIPKGFEFDGASIPIWIKPLVSLLDPWERHEQPAAVHDLLYGIQLASRFQADAFFRELMQDAGVPWVPRLLIYAAVRVGGGKAWRQNREQGLVGGYRADQQLAANTILEPLSAEGLA